MGHQLLSICIKLQRHSTKTWLPFGWTGGAISSLNPFKAWKAVAGTLLTGCQGNASYSLYAHAIKQRHTLEGHYTLIYGSFLWWAPVRTRKLHGELSSPANRATGPRRVDDFLVDAINPDEIKSSHESHAHEKNIMSCRVMHSQECAEIIGNYHLGLTFLTALHCSEPKRTTRRD